MPIMIIEASYNGYRASSIITQPYLLLSFINLKTIILFLKTFTTLYFPKKSLKVSNLSNLSKK